jgi:hypothetical protein
MHYNIRHIPARINVQLYWYLVWQNTGFQQPFKSNLFGARLTSKKLTNVLFLFFKSLKK